MGSRLGACARTIWTGDAVLLLYEDACTRYIDIVPCAMTSPCADPYTSVFCPLRRVVREHLLLRQLLIPWDTTKFRRLKH